MTVKRLCRRLKLLKLTYLLTYLLTYVGIYFCHIRATSVAEARALNGRKDSPTDGQTHEDIICRASIASRGKNRHRKAFFTHAQSRNC